MKRILLIAGLLCIAVNAFGADGDLIVNGKLGVGTTSSLEAAKLVIANGGLPSNTSGWMGNEIVLGNTTSASAFFHSGGYATWWTNGGTGINLQVNGGTNAMTVNNYGNIGIGTTNPGAAKLVVANGGLPSNTSGWSGNDIVFGTSSSASAFYHSGGYATWYANSGTGVMFDVNAGNPAMTLTSSGNVGIGTTTPSYTLHVNGNTYSLNGYYSGSDERWKKNITPLTDSLANVLKLQGKSYEWNQEAASTEVASTGTTSDSVVNADGSPVAKPAPPHFEEGRQIGLIAQEVEKVFPELVRTDEKGFKAISYDKLTVVLIEAIKEQQKRIGALEERIKALEGGTQP